MKKIIIILFSLLLIPVNVLAEGNNSVIVMDIGSGRILYQKNADSKRLIASTTKIMTCIIVLENSNIEDVITIGNEVLSMYGTNIYITPGEKMSIKDLLYGLMLRSGNDAAIALAVNTLGEENFINAMNEKASKIGMKNTIFKNPHGLDDDTENYSTAYDMALLSKYAYNNKIYRKIISTKKYVTKSSLKSYVWYNRMSLLNDYKYCVGGKNGYTPKAGKSLVSYSKKDNLILTIVSLGDPSIYDSQKKLYDEYFLKYKNYKIIDKGDFRINIFDNNEYLVKNEFSYPLTYDEIDDVTTLVKLSNDLNKAGTIEVKLNDEVIGKVDIKCKSETKKENISLFKKILNLLI